MAPLVTRQRLIAQVPYIAVGLVVALGLVLVIFAYWRRGVVTIGAAMALAGLLRLLLPARRAGLLSVRSRGFDVAAYIFLAVALVGIGVAIPAPVL
ncbi:MAG: DUF3017 domain-containing protein [Geodermatophilaceae bacterium]|nr:DUF3017 domain-containing protein [Geodermatophilaceae bacterium]MDQ3476153.1 DUF3017 domain-containing protein [Actinomycetota bacterium]